MRTWKNGPLSCPRARCTSPSKERGGESISWDSPLVPRGVRVAFRERANFPPASEGVLSDVATSIHQAGRSSRSTARPALSRVEGPASAGKLRRSKHPTCRGPGALKSRSGTCDPRRKAEEQVRDRLWRRLILYGPPAAGILLIAMGALSLACRQRPAKRPRKNDTPRRLTGGVAHFWRHSAALGALNSCRYSSVLTKTCLASSPISTPLPPAALASAPPRTPAGGGPPKRWPGRHLCSTPAAGVFRL